MPHASNLTQPSAQNQFTKNGPYENLTTSQDWMLLLPTVLISYSFYAFLFDVVWGEHMLCCVVGKKTFTIPYKHSVKTWWNLYLKDDETVSHKCIAFVVRQNQLPVTSMPWTRDEVGTNSRVMAEETFIGSQLSILVDISSTKFPDSVRPALYLPTEVHNTSKNYS